MGRQGLTQSCNGSRATEDFSWVSINWRQKPVDSFGLVFFIYIFFFDSSMWRNG